MGEQETKTTSFPSAAEVEVLTIFVFLTTDPCVSLLFNIKNNYNRFWVWKRAGHYLPHISFGA